VSRFCGTSLLDSLDSLDSLDVPQFATPDFPAWYSALAPSFGKDTPPFCQTWMLLQHENVYLHIRQQYPTPKTPMTLQDGNGELKSLEETRAKSKDATLASLTRTELSKKSWADKTLFDRK